MPTAVEYKKALSRLKKQLSKEIRRSERRIEKNIGKKLRRMIKSRKLTGSVHAIQ